VLVATGSEVSLAVDVSKLLQETGLDLRVVSMPAFELFLRQSESYRKKIVPENTIPLIVLETGVEQGWHRLSRSPLLFIGMDRFGASAPAAVLAEKFGFTAESAAGKIKKWLKSLQ